MRTITKIFAAALLLCAVSTDANAQKWLKSLGDALDKGTSAVTDVSSALTTVTEATASTDTSSINKDALLTETTFEIKPVVETDEKGDTLKNDDGTIKYHYLVLDGDGKVCDADVAQKMVSTRQKAYGAIIGKVAGTTALGALGGILKKDTKAALTGAATGALAGLALSGSDMKKIKTLNKNLKSLKATLEAYKKTFNEEGLPIDPSADLSDVDGIDFTKAEAITKTAAEVKAEIAASKESTDSLENIDFDKL